MLRSLLNPVFESITSESLSAKRANIESTDVNEIKEHIETKDVTNETNVSFSVDTNEFRNWGLELDNLQEGSDQNRIAIRVNGIDSPEYYFYDISGTKHIDETEIALYEPSGPFTFASGDVRMSTRADTDVLGLNYRPRHARDRLTGIDAVDFGGTDAELNIDDINTIDLISIGGGDWNAGEVSLFGINRVVDQ